MLFNLNYNHNISEHQFWHFDNILVELVHFIDFGDFQLKIQTEGCTIRRMAAVKSNSIKIILSRCRDR